MSSLTILRFHPLGEEPNLAKIAGKLMNTGRNRVHSFLTRGFGWLNFLVVGKFTSGGAFVAASVAF